MNLQKMQRSANTAELEFRRLHMANRVVYALLGILVMLAIWNVVTVITINREVAPDLGEISSISDHISTTLIRFMGLITLIALVFKEWRWGEREVSNIYVIAALLILVLIPVAGAETHSRFEEQQIQLSVMHCQPGSIEGSEVIDRDTCTQTNANADDMFLSKTNPANGEFEEIAPTATRPLAAIWDIKAPEEYTIYFLIRQDSLSVCEASLFVSSLAPTEQQGHTCIERDGAAWSVHPQVISSYRQGAIILYQQSAP